jgi:hypothetical protein
MGFSLFLSGLSSIPPFVFLSSKLDCHIQGVVTTYALLCFLFLSTALPGRFLKQFGHGERLVAMRFTIDSTLAATTADHLKSFPFSFVLDIVVSRPRYINL